MIKLTKKQHAQDSFIFGAILAGAKARKKKLVPSLPAMEMPDGMCAVGAGNRGLKATRWSDVVTKTFQKEHKEIFGKGTSTTLHQLIPLVRFATAAGVTENYACGVNDGFEDNQFASKSFYAYVDRESLDYERGYHVGQAVRIEFVSE